MILASLSLSDLIVCKVPVEDPNFAAPLDNFLRSIESLGRCVLIALRPIATAEADCYFRVFVSYYFRLPSSFCNGKRDPEFHVGFSGICRRAESLLSLRYILELVELMPRRARAAFLAAILLPLFLLSLKFTRRVASSNWVILGTDE